MLQNVDANLTTCSKGEIEEATFGIKIINFIQTNMSIF